MAQASYVIFIHGLANKPPPDQLRDIWLNALAADFDNNKGFDLGAKGVREKFVYWANLFYKNPMLARNYESRKDELNESVEDDIELPADAWMQLMLKKFPIDEDNIFGDAPTSEVMDPQYERIPLPWFVKKLVIKHFLKEAHNYLFNVNGIRDKIRKQVIDSINQRQADEQVVLVGHSLGAVIAYDVLSDMPEAPEVDGFVTIGSPLGIDEIQDKLTWSRDNGFPSKLKGSWVNVYDPYDIVARLDPRHANDFKKEGMEAVIDVKESNNGVWRHSATKYLQGVSLRNHLRELAGRA